MEFPDDLPWVVEYFLPPIAGVGKEDVWFDRHGNRHTYKGCVQTAYPRRPVQGKGSSGDTDARGWCQVIPFNATHYRVLGGEWRRIAEMPPSWLPFVQRQRGSVMDCRSPPCPNCGRDSPVYGQLCPRCQLKREKANG